MTDILLSLILLFVILSWYQQSNLSTRWSRWRKLLTGRARLRLDNYLGRRKVRRSKQV